MTSLARILISSAILLLPPLAGITWSSAATGEPSGTLILDSLSDCFEPVTFDHEMHQDGYSCAACHHHTTGNNSGATNCCRCHALTNRAETVRCSDCHGTPETLPEQLNGEAPGLYHIDTPGLKGALHLQCLGCHREEGGPVGCHDCHEFTPVGEKRFFTAKEP